MAQDPPTVSMVMVAMLFELNYATGSVSSCAFVQVDREEEDYHCYHDADKDVSDVHLIH